MNKRISLLIFDCDGVLVDSEYLANTLFASICRDLGFSISDEEAMEQFPGNRFSTCVQYVEAKNGRSVPPEILPLFRQRCSEVFAARLLPIDGMTEVLNGLQRPKVVASR
jgi:beta-phosphoglucomutase-like phosphatase (HAD superfamily)